MMDFLDVLLKRRSIRKYADGDIPEEKLEKILQAGLLAPTSRNQKPCVFYVVRDREVLRKLSEAKSAGAWMIADCNTAIAVFADSRKADTWVEDCSIAMSYMMLMAEEQNVGNCWVQMHFRKDAEGKDAEENVKNILNVSENYRIAGILAMGIAAEDAKPHTQDEIDWEKVHRI